MGSMPYKKRKRPKSSPSLSHSVMHKEVMRATEMAVLCKPGKAPSPAAESVGTLIFHFQPPGLSEITVRSVRHSVHSILFQQSKLKLPLAQLKKLLRELYSFLILESSLQEAEENALRTYKSCAFITQRPPLRVDCHLNCLDSPCSAVVASFVPSLFVLDITFSFVLPLSS